MLDKKQKTRWALRLASGLKSGLV